MFYTFTNQTLKPIYWCIFLVSTQIIHWVSAATISLVLKINILLPKFHYFAGRFSSTLYKPYNAYIINNLKKENYLHTGDDILSLLHHWDFSIRADSVIYL